MRRALLAILCLMGAGCDQSAPTADAGPKEVALAPGMWRIEAAIDSIDGGALPPDVIEAIKQERQIGTEVCLSPPEVQRPPSRFFTALQHDCAYERLKLDDGDVSAALRCSVEDYVHSMELDGTYGPVAYSIHENHVIEHPPSGERLSLVLTGRGRRTGEC